jgi:hypothetical protein
MAEPQNGDEALVDIVSHVEEATLKHVNKRKLDPGCLIAYRDGDPIKKGNLKRFQDRFQTHWENDKDVLRRTAGLHGQVCSVIADFLDGSGPKSDTIDVEVFAIAGKVARAVCPLGGSTDTHFTTSSAGAWCSWP